MKVLRSFRGLVGVSLACCLVIACLAYAQDTTVVWIFQNGFKLGAERLSGMSRASTTGIQIGGSDVATVMVAATTGLAMTAPATETITAGATITANACGGLKRITAAGAVTSNTTDTFTDPATVPTGCVMFVCNVGANAITLDKNTHIFLVSGADVSLGANACVSVGNDGTEWRQLTAVLTAT